MSSGNRPRVIFEEVDHFEGEFAERLTSLGWEWRYHQKESQAPDNQRDGLLIFWKPAVFKLESYQEVSLAVTMPDLLPEAKANLAQLATFVHVESSRKVSLSNCHLYWRPGFDDLRAVQAMYLRQELEQFAPEGSVLIMAGDFNSDPPSLAYQWLTGVDIQDQVANRLQIAGLPQFPSPRCALRSAYSLYYENGDAPWTAWSDFRACIDYLFIGDEVVVKRLLDLPRDEIVTSEQALPNHLYVSDHVALQAELGFHC